MVVNSDNESLSESRCESFSTEKITSSESPAPLTSSKEMGMLRVGLGPLDTSSSKYLCGCCRCCEQIQLWPPNGFVASIPMLVAVSSTLSTLHFLQHPGDIVKPGLWTGTVDWTVDWTVNQPSNVATPQHSEMKVSQCKLKDFTAWNG